MGPLFRAAADALASDNWYRVPDGRCVGESPPNPDPEPLGRIDNIINYDDVGSVVVG